MTVSLWEYTTDVVSDELKRIARTAPDVYVVMVFVWTAPSTDPRWSTIRLRWDTEERYAERASGAPDSDRLALRWSRQYLLRSDREWWDRDDDPPGHDALKHWAIDRALWFEGERDEVDDATVDLGLELADRLIERLIATVRKMHSDGTVQAAFGRDIPVVLMPHDSHSRYPEWNRDANPPELYAQFGPYYESVWGPG
jgi:hypothetical protein